jgi:uncharacterized protein YbcV (DUF1398 family)
MDAEAKSKIEQIYMDAESYPDLVQRLIEAGIRSYTVDAGTGTILYRLSEGNHFLHEGHFIREVAPKFSRELTIQAIRDNQQGRSDYQDFMNAIAKAGVRFYEATLEGENKRVTYIGTGGSYVESIPV